RVRFRTPEVEALAGLELHAVQDGSLSEVIEANATLAFDGNRYAHLSARAQGVLRSIAVGVGDQVVAGAPLATVEAVELGSAKTALFRAEAMVGLWTKNRDREQELLDQGVSAARTLLEAETRLVE